MDIRWMWQNGGRPLLLASAMAILSLTFLGMAFLVANFWPSESPFAPLAVSNVTINSRIPDRDSPAIRAGQHYNGTITICNNNDEIHTITFVIQLERLGGPVHFVSLGSVEFPIEPGCATLTGDSAPLPEQVGPGVWRESSSAIVQRGDQKQTVSFVSEPFEVLP
jgi:hypothetical protein